MAQIPPDTGGEPPVADPPGAPPEAPPAAPAPPAEPPSMEPPPPEEPITFASSKALDERLARARANERARWLKDQGFESEEDFAAFKTAADERAAEIEKAKRQEMTEIERLKADLEAQRAETTAAEEARQAAIEEAEAARTETHLHGLFAARGIKNTGYAMFKIEEALDALPDGEELDEVALLDQLMADETQQAALGIAAAEPQEGLAQTVPPRNGPPPVPATPKEFDAMTADADAWAQRRKELGV